MQTIKHAVIHKLIKDKHGRATVVERIADLAITDPVKKLVLDIHDLYASRASKGYGRFESDEINFPSAQILKRVFVSNELGFFDASKLLLKVLATRADSVALATGGYVLMAHVINQANISWFIVAIINNVDDNVIDDASLDVLKAVHVDLKNLRVAGRVNITDWLGGDKDTRYVGFLKQHGEVADYFKIFLGCNELVVNTEETKKLVSVLKQFSKQEGLDQKTEEDFLQAAYNFCLERNKSDQPLSLEALSNAIWPNEPQKLQKAFVENDVQISDGFVPDGRSIKSLMRMKYKTDYWTIDLDRHALSSGYAHYNQTKGELILRNLPDGLKAELNRELKDDS